MSVEYYIADALSRAIKRGAKATKKMAKALLEITTKAWSSIREDIKKRLYELREKRDEERAQQLEVIQKKLEDRVDLYRRATNIVVDKKVDVADKKTRLSLQRLIKAEHTALLNEEFSDTELIARAEKILDNLRLSAEEAACKEASDFLVNSSVREEAVELALLAEQSTADSIEKRFEEAHEQLVSPQREDLLLRAAQNLLEDIKEFEKCMNCSHNGDTDSTHTVSTFNEVHGNISIGKSDEIQENKQIMEVSNK